jgi:2',3'-cyclic-nucleotide 2'-phosphodiesterase/3'-nucleotidase
MLPGVMLSIALAAMPQDSAHLVVVATTDVHGRATAWNYLYNTPYSGGLARAATVVDSLRARYPDRVVLVDAGDVIQGNPFAEYFARVAPRDPHPIVDAMNLMAYDAATVGNHDFDYGLESLRRVIAGAAFPYVSANVTFTRVPTALPRVVVVQRGAVRVAITGVTTPGVMVWNAPQVAGQVQVAPIPVAAPAALAEARRSADVTIVLAHSGMRGPSAYDTTGVGGEHVAARLATMPDPPDLVVVGHSHAEMLDSLVSGVHFIQPRPYARTLAVAHVRLVRVGSGWRVASIRGERIPLDQAAPDPRVERRLQTDHQAVLTWASTSLGTATAPMPATLGRARPTPIINFIHDAQRRRTGARLSAAAAFDLDAGFREGPILLSDVAALYPYENSLRAVRLSGAQLKEFLEHSVRYFQVRDGRIEIDESIPGYNYDMVAGAEYRVDLSRPIGSRIIGLAVEGVPVRDDDHFTMALNSYRQAGGGGYRMLAGAPVVYDRGENVRDVLVEAVRSRGALDPARFNDTNWSIIPGPAAAAVEALFRPSQDPRPRQRPLVRVFAISDLRGTLVAQDGTVPLAALKVAIDSSSAACSCPTLLVSAGDQLQGTPTADLQRGRPVVAALNRLGLAVSTLGPADLAWSLDTLARRAEESDFEWVNANVIGRDGGARPVWLRSSRVLEVGQLRIGVVGFLSPTLFHQSRTRDLASLEAGAAATIPAVADRLREQGKADVILLLAQAEQRCVVGGCTEELFGLAESLRGHVDLILAGGAATVIDTVVGGVPIVQAPGLGRGWAQVDLVPGPEGWEWRSAVLTPSAPSRTDSTMVALARQAQSEADGVLQRNVARVRLPMPVSHGPSALSLLVADAFRNAERADVGLVPLDMLAAGLEAGPTTYGDLLQVFPNEVRVVAADLSGATLTALVERALEATAPSLDISGATVRYDERRRAGDRVRSIRLLDGRTVRDEDVYSVALPETMLRSPWMSRTIVPARAPSGDLADVDAVVRYLSLLPQPVDPPRKDRFHSND